MAADTFFSFVPRMGWSNVVSVLDGATVRPDIQVLGTGAYITRDVLGVDANPNAAVLAPDGREGNMKISAEIVIKLITAIVDPIDILMLVNIPPSMKGLVSPSLRTSAQWLDTANWPLCDYAKFLPACAVKPTFYPTVTNETTTGNPLLFDNDTTPWAGATFGAGAVSYYPAGWAADGFVPGTFSNVGPAGALLCRFTIDGATPAVGQSFELSVDFSNSLTN